MKKVLLLLGILLLGITVTGCGMGKETIKTKENQDRTALSSDSSEENNENEDNSTDKVNKVKVKDENLILAEEACEKMFVDWMENSGVR